jgi:hypothetical protein
LARRNRVPRGRSVLHRQRLGANPFRPRGNPGPFLSFYSGDIERCDRNRAVRGPWGVTCRLRAGGLHGL